VIRFASFDLDGTVLDPRGAVAEGVVAGVRRLRRAGVRSFVNTGRPLASVRSIPRIDRLLAVCEDAVLVDDAEAVFRPATGRTEALAVLPGCALDQVRAQCRHFVVSCGGRLFASSRRAARSYALAYRLPQSVIEPGTGEPTRGAHRVTVFDGAPAGIDAVTVDPITPFAASVVRPAHSGKAAGLARFLAAFHAGDLSDVVAFGDGDADADLLARSAIGVAVRASSPAAVAAASVHLAGPLDEFLAEFDPYDRRWATRR